MHAAIGWHVVPRSRRWGADRSADNGTRRALSGDDETFDEIPRPCDPERVLRHVLVWVALGILLGSGCGSTSGGGGGIGADGGTLGNALCGAPYPASACDGDPHGKWTLTSLCVNRYENCPGAAVTSTGTAKATIEFQEGSSDSRFDYQYSFDLETHLSVPKSCLGNASCESIGCFAGDDPCSCVVGSGSGGSTGGFWTPNISGEVKAELGSAGKTTSLQFCAGATTADSIIEGRRVVWARDCTEGMDCRPSDPCHVGKAHCAAGAPMTCEDTGANRPIGTACGEGRVCDAGGACIGCVAGDTCTLADQPCRTAVISCRSAAPVCTANGILADGAVCGAGKTCLAGSCKTNDGESCSTAAECKDSCVCADAQCGKRYCGNSCPCHFAPAGGACGAPLADGTSQPGVCDGTKACYGGQCKIKTGIYCNTNAECGTGNCTCIDSTCIRLLCSPVACPCQWANSGSTTCGGPLVDGLHDLSCQPPKACTAGTCR
jgi:hypothetical protein